MRVLSSGISSSPGGGSLVTIWTGVGCGPDRSWSRCGRRAPAPSWSWDAGPATTRRGWPLRGIRSPRSMCPARLSGRRGARFGSMARFLVADMTQPLPFPDGGFDAVMSNVAVHMFPDSVTRAVFAEVGRLVRAGGLFVFHVNALEDRPLRARRLPAREVEPDYVAEESGQTMHFFSEDYLRELLGGWQEVQLVPVAVPHRGAGEL